MPHLVATDLQRSFTLAHRQIDVLRGVSLSVEQGESLFLCGPSGAGKTTLLYTLAGLEKPDRGTVEISGRALYTGNADRQARIRNTEVGFVFQSYFLLPELTALENVLLPQLIGGGRNEAKARAALGQVGLGDRTHHLPAEMSGGEQQRVAIARALINDPSIVFADEPTGNLDSHTGETIVDLLLALVREKRKTLVVVTHDRGLAARGDRTLVIQDGQFA